MAKALFASFRGGHWISSHIDDLKADASVAEVMQIALKKPISQFLRFLIEKPIMTELFNPIHLLHNCIQAAVSKLISFNFEKRAKDVVDILHFKLPSCNSIHDNCGKFNHHVSKAH